MYLMLFILCLGFGSASTLCGISRTGSGSRVDCSNNELITVPQDLPTDTTSLDLSLNNFNHLNGSLFKYMTRLAVLNMTASNILSFSETTFLGLSELRELYLMNNPGIERMPTNIFLGCPGLRQISLSMEGHNVDIRPLLVLQQLETVSLTVLPTSMPYDLVRLPNLKTIYFVKCNFPHLTKELLTPFVSMQLKELAFLGSNIRSVQNGTFDDFSSLDTLNLAGNGLLFVNDIIDVMSNSRNLKVQRLILDRMNNGGYLYIGPVDVPNCRPAWTHLRHLSMRAVKLSVILPSFAHCLQNLVTVAVGFNVFLIGGEVRKSDVLAVNSLRSIDVAYGFTSHDDVSIARQAFASDGRSNWIPKSGDYSPTVIDHSDCEDFTNNTAIIIPEECDKMNINYIYPPRCVSYMDMHDFGLHRLTAQRCAVVSSNTLIYLNISRIPFQDIKMKKPVLGLDLLTTLDISESGMINLPVYFFPYMTSLKEVRAARNKITSINLTSAADYVEYMDLNENQITSVDLKSDGKSSFKTLLLANNMLASIDFITPNMSLNRLDLRNNYLMNISDIIISRIETLGRLNPGFKLSLSGNPFQCDCTTIDLIHWIQSTSINITDRRNLRCADTNDKGKIMDVDISKLRLKCKLFLVMFSTLGVTVLVIMGSSATVYKFRWTLRWKYYSYKHAKQQNRSDDYMDDMIRIDRINTAHVTYIIYAEEDQETRHWVVNCLLDKIENEWQMGPVFLPGRDDIAGDSVCDNITRGLLNSQSAIWILNPAFCEDTSCNIAATFAFHRFNQFRKSQNLIILLDDQLNNYNNIDRVRNFLDRRMGLTKITYTNNEDGQFSFWARLREFLEIRCNPDIHLSTRFESVNEIY